MKKSAIFRQALAALSLLGLIASTPLTAAEQPQQPEQTGLTYYVLRVIYPEGANKGVTLTTYNKTDKSWLLQSFIRPVNHVTGDVDIDNADNQPLPFIVTPPLERLEANSELTLRIRRNNEPLPTDRESVFFISMKAIPGQPLPDDNAVEGHVAIAVINSMKVFYRPDGLETQAIADNAAKLRFHKKGQELIADNPTPYWMTFASLKVGNNPVDKAQQRLMVPPKGQRSYHFPQGTAGAVEWELVDEDSWKTPIQRQD